MTANSVFRIYSMTKPLVSVAAMLLVEDGVIQITDPVSKFLPAFKDMQVSVATTSADGKVTYSNVPAVRPITVQDLLRHSAGLAYAEITKNEPVKGAYVEAKFSQPGVHEYDSRGMTPNEQVERIAKAPLVHQPGTTWEYSMAVDVLGRVGGGCVRQAAQRLHGRASVSAAEDGRHELLVARGQDAASCAASGCRSSIRPKDQRARCIRRTSQRFRRSRGTFDRNGLPAVRADAS
jgi:hypothetical protein